MKKDIILRHQFDPADEVVRQVNIDLRTEIELAGLTLLDILDETTMRAAGEKEQFEQLRSKIGKFYAIANPAVFVPL